MKKSLKTLKKRIRMGRWIDIENLVLARLPWSLQVQLSHRYCLIRDKYRAGDTIVSLNSGDMIELAQDYRNGDIKIEYRNIWEYFNGQYEKEYDDDFGGTLSLMPCDLIFKAPKEWKKYDHIYRFATLREIKLK
jgi:hypothetical protein